MTVDATQAGHNLNTVGVALTGAAAIMELTADFAAPTPEEFGAADYALPIGFTGLGLRTEDGAPEWTDEVDGDPLTFYEDGFTIPTGQVTSRCAMTLAQTEPMVIELKTGAALDTHGVADLDLGGHAQRYVLYTEDVFKTADGGFLIERRMAVVTVESVVTQKPERGQARGHVVTFANARHALFGGKHMRYARIAG